MLRQHLAQKLQQKLSPQQIQLMKLLQIPTANLEQRIKEELEANPALEEGEAIDNALDELDKKADDLDNTSEDGEETDPQEELNLEDYFDDDGEYPDYKSSVSNHSADDEQKTIPISVGTTFHEHLLKQLSTRKLSEEDFKIGKQIIGSIGDDGYLRRELINIVDDLAFGQSIYAEEEKIEEILLKIHDFDPAGVGARNLQECLLLQLKQKTASPPVKIAIKILEKHFDQFTKKHFNKLKNAYSLEDDELKTVMDEILKLNPKPGSTYSGDGKNSVVHQYVTPDFTVKNDTGELSLMLNMRNAPELKVSSSFKEMYDAYKASKEASSQQKKDLLFIKQKMDAARWFIDAIKQRQQTMMLTMQAILDYQKDYFLTGDETQLRPMILKDIAEVTGLDISTVSRVANSKYVQTEFGTILLKFFFSESIQTSSGEEVSTREVKSILQDIINEENKRKPYSDQKLMELLKEKKYEIARRTVAKYREQLNIPVARMRKEL
ncbi:MAG: RNA polymerase factor sigma-54 [Chitinophagales bacterium]